ncbi:response regulator [Thermodesulfovibrio hydrogeniphilus]
MLRRLVGENISLTFEPEKDLWHVYIDPAQISQILTNMCINAKDAIQSLKETGNIIISTKNISLDQKYCASHPDCIPGEYVMLTISDDGCGMDEATVAKIFEPFFTTKELRKGTGLGLATVYGIVKQNNGFINVYSELGKGTTFKIYLPRHTAEEPKDIERKRIEELAGGGETVLLVEDEPAILDMITIMLQSMGYNVIAAGNPKEAIKLAKERKGKIDLVITDVIMPEMNGRDLVDRIKSLYPDIKCLFMSGYPADVISKQGILEKGMHFIEKPFSLDDFSAKLKEILET